jgi:hypothetical protein
VTDEVPPVTPTVVPEKLVKVYLKMKAKHDEMRITYEAEEKKLKTQMDTVKSALLGFCKRLGVYAQVYCRTQCAAVTASAHTPNQPQRVP